MLSQKHSKQEVNVSRRTRVYTQPEEYKIGWVHGFYGCISDDGARYDGRHCYSLASGRADAAKLYQDGYRDGRRARLENHMTPVAVRNGGLGQGADSIGSQIDGETIDDIGGGGTAGRIGSGKISRKNLGLTQFQPKEPEVFVVILLEREAVA